MKLDYSIPYIRINSNSTSLNSENLAKIPNDDKIPTNMQLPYRKPGKYTNLRPDPLLTKEKFLALQNELAKLKKIQPKAAADVATLAQLGDFSENAEYQIAKGRLRGINGHIAHLEQQLGQAEVFTPEKQTDTVSLGHHVTTENNGKQKTYLILGSTETDPQAGVISYQSPIGAALMGKSVGDIVKVKLTTKEVEYKIIAIK